MSVSEISRKSIRRILKLKTNPIPMLDVKNKLEIFAVKTGLKSAFQGSRNIEREPKKELSLLKQIAIMMKLKHKTTINPPLYFSRKPKVRSSFLKAYYNPNSFEALWIFDDPVVEAKIDDCILGKLNEGHILAYPKCCIRWHEEKRVLEVESSLEDLENHIARNPLLVHQLPIKTEEEMYKNVLNMSYPTEKKDKFRQVVNRHIIKTYERYPFVPHWACSNCLEGESKETEGLNRKYEALALTIGFHDDFLNKINQALHDLEKAPFD